MNILKMLSVKEDMAQYYFLVIDSFFNEKVKLREEFNISKEDKEFHILKSIRRRYTTPITSIIDEIL